MATWKPLFILHREFPPLDTVSSLERLLDEGQFDYSAVPLMWCELEKKEVFGLILWASPPPLLSPTQDIAE